MGIALSTIGVKFSYAVETVAGQRPTAGYKHIPDIKSIASFNPEPNTADTTTFDNKEYTSSIPLLKEMGGALPFDANFTQELFDLWDSMVDEYEAAIVDKKQTWYCVDIPGFNESAYFTGSPARMGIPEMSANSELSTTVYVTPTGEPIYEADPTYADTTLLGD